MADGTARQGEPHQARRHRRNSWWAVAIIVLLSAFLGGMGIWLLAAPPPAMDPDEATAVGAVFAALGLLALVGAWFVWRRAHPPRLKNVELTVTPHEVPRGGRIHASVSLASPPRADVQLELALICSELYDVMERVSNPNGPDTEQRATKEAVRHRATVPIDATGASADFEIPADEPFSYNGDCISAVWKVRVQERRPRRADRVVDELVWVLP
jgi:hypothetical protein